MNDTGRTIGAAPSTAAFVRAQIANGVSVETLRRKLGIRPEHMIQIVPVAPSPPVVRAPPVTPPPAPVPMPMLEPQAVDSNRERDTILKVVAAAWEVTPEELLSKGRERRLSNPRQAVYLLMMRRGNTLRGICRAMGLADHSGLGRGVARAEQLYEIDRDWRRRFDRVCKRLAKEKAGA